MGVQVTVPNKRQTAITVDENDNLIVPEGRTVDGVDVSELPGAIAAAEQHAEDVAAAAQAAAESHADTVAANAQAAAQSHAATALAGHGIDDALAIESNAGDRPLTGLNFLGITVADDGTVAMQLTSGGANGGSPKVFAGNRSPQGSVNADFGDLYLRAGGSTTTSGLYVGNSAGGSSWRVFINTAVGGSSGSIPHLNTSSVGFYSIDATFTYEGSARALAVRSPGTGSSARGFVSADNAGTTRGWFGYVATGTKTVLDFTGAASGGEIVGSVNVDGNWTFAATRTLTVNTPTAAGHAATKGYVDGAVPTFAEGTWSPTVSNLTGYEATPTVEWARYTRIGNIVRASVALSCTFTTGGQKQLQVTLPVARGGNFASNYQATGGGGVESPSPTYTAGFVRAVSGAQRVRFVAPVAATTSTGAIHFEFTYEV